MLKIISFVFLIGILLLSSVVYASPLDDFFSFTRDLWGKITGLSTYNATCTGLNLTFNNSKTTYVQGETATYTYTCTPSGSTSYVAVQVVKPDGTVTPYNTLSGAVTTQTLGFGTSNLVPGNYVLRACFSTDCEPVTASAQFTIVASTTVPPTPSNLVGSLIKNETNVELSYTSTTDVLEFRIYHRLQGTDWPTTSYDIRNLGSLVSAINDKIVIHLSAPSESGVYEYKVQACNSAGCSSDSNVATITKGDTTTQTTTNQTVTSNATNATSSLKGIGQKCSSNIECASGICIYTYCSPQPQPATKPATVTLEGTDGTWCYVSVQIPPSMGGVYSAQRKGYCQDNTGVYYDFCSSDGTVVRDYYCGGTWTGVYKNVKCTHGGYTCSNYVGDACSDGACIFFANTSISQCSLGSSIQNYCICGDYSYNTGYCCSSGWQSTPCGTASSNISTTTPNVTQTCPTCPSPSQWSTCINNNQTRTSYRCSSGTTYQCQSYVESQSCTTPSNITPPVTAPPTETPATPSTPPIQTSSGGGGGGGGGTIIPTCKAQGAAICSISETCSEKWLTAGDADRCCSRVCLPIAFNKTEVEKKTEELSQAKQQAPQAAEISMVLPALELAKENITNPEHINKIEQVAVETLEIVKFVASFENQTKTRGVDYSIRWLFGFVAEQERRDAQFLEARSEELLTSSNKLKLVAGDLEDVNAKDIILGESEKLKMQADELSQGAKQKRENARGILSWIVNFFG